MRFLCFFDKGAGIADMTDADRNASQQHAPPTVIGPNSDTDGAAPILPCFSVDVEEYYHAEVYHAHLTQDARAALPQRAARGVELLANLLERSESRGTFFVLGSEARRLGPLLREIVGRGHEIACHGFNHQHLSRLTFPAFREDLKRAKAEIEDAVGVTPRGYRAPTFSVTRRTAWALDALIAEGFSYDASIFPIRHDRYGVPGAPTVPYWAISPDGREILEFPPLTLGGPYLRIPAGGGGYLRLLPTWIIDQALTRRARDGRPALLYIHPWELDPEQPKLPLPRFSQWRHRVNLDRTEHKLRRLLSCRRFTTIRRVLETLKLDRLPRYCVDRSQTTLELRSPKHA